MRKGKMLLMRVKKEDEERERHYVILDCNEC